MKKIVLKSKLIRKGLKAIFGFPFYIYRINQKLNNINHAIQNTSYNLLNIVDIDIFNDLEILMLFLDEKDKIKYENFIKSNFHIILKSNIMYKKLSIKDKDIYLKWLLFYHGKIDFFVKENIQKHNDDLKYLNDIFSKKEDVYSLKNIGFDINLVSDSFIISSTILYEFYLKQYKYSDETYLKEGDIILDCGAFIGDTALLFAHDTNYNCNIHSFELSDGNIEIFKKNIKANPKTENIIKINKLAISNISDQELFFNDLKNGSKLLNEKSNNIIKSISIDDYVEREKLEKVDFIKMDIEGAELKGLIGAKKTIEKYKPKLAICIYHKISDIYEIPSIILKINSNYKFYFNIFNYNHGWEAILYAV